MSKGNLFLGYGRGKIGDIVLTRGEGQQISRARNRAPRNPKTEKQMYQRAVMATVMQMYKAGKSIFDHSFQGKQVSLGNMSRFMSVNAKILRTTIESDIANNEVYAAVVSPGAVSPVPFRYRISEGTFPAGLATVVDSTQALWAIGASNNLTQAQAFTPGDIYTVVAVAIEGDSTADDKISPATVFGWVRLKTKSTLSGTTLVSATKFSDVFEIETYNCTFNAAAIVNTDISLAVLFGSGIVKGCMGMIHSREDSGLRSTCDMTGYDEVVWGVKSANISEVWNAAVNPLGQSELILEGGDTI